VSPANDRTSNDEAEGPSTARRWVKRFFLLVGAAFGLALALFAVAYARTDVPDPNEGFDSEATIVYYAGGKQELGRLAEQNRTMVELQDVPQHVQDAVIAAEDRSFWDNQGIDPKGIVRAAFNNATGGDTQGASTITQQYVKVYYLSQERTYTRKLREAILSLKVHRQLSKEEILEGYLNTIFFGRSAYGIEAAAQAYFDKPVTDLGPRQSAALAAIINSPNAYDPADGKQARQALRSRYTYVIDRMNELGTFPGVKGDPYKLPKFAKPGGPDSNRYGGQRGHMLRIVQQQLRDLGYSDQEIIGGGLRVTTTFTKNAMRAAEEGVTSVRPELKGLHAAAATVDVENGALRGMYAGQDYLDSQINWAVEGGAPGSTFKPFTLATALEYGYALDSTFNGNSPIEVGGATFSNQGEGDGESYGSQISLLSATENSVNTAYVDLADTMDDGVGQIVDTAVDMGIPRNAPGLDENLSMVLGSATISVIDMANAFGTIAAEGQAKDWYVIQQVKGPGGGSEYKHKAKTRQAISEDVAADTSYALQRVATNGTGTNANVIGRPVAGKTGTATNDDGDVRSSWYVGYTPQLSTAVMYTRGNGNQPLNGFLPTFYGGEYPARTWAAIMGAALEGQEILSFPPPADIEQTAAGNEPLPTYTPSPTEEDSPTEEPSEEPTEEETTPPGNGNGNGNGNGGGGNGGGGNGGGGGNDGDGGGGGGDTSDDDVTSPDAQPTSDDDTSTQSRGGGGSTAARRASGSASDEDS
jgi:membrane peptidoglycan carboxypeptidase